MACLWGGLGYSVCSVDGSGSHNRYHSETWTVTAATKPHSTQRGNGPSNGHNSGLCCLSNHIRQQHICRRRGINGLVYIPVPYRIIDGGSYGCHGISARCDVENVIVP